MSQYATDGRGWTEVAASAYRAYAASTGNKNFRGDPMPGFDDLPLPIKTAWEAAVRQARDLMETPHDEDAPGEQRWQGWVRPQDQAAEREVG
jgi:hypothetical protein